VFVAVLDQLHITTQPSTYTPFIGIMKFITALVTSVATLSAANPLPFDLDVKSSLVARADIVEVTCPALNNHNQVTYSVTNVDDAFTIGSGILRMTPPDYVLGTNGMYWYTPCFVLVVVGFIQPLIQNRKTVPQRVLQHPEHCSAR
jgi:hypothetical protein